MKHILLIAGLLLGGISIAQAQDDGNDQAKKDIGALYVAYITKELNMNPDEAKQFWPVHTQFDAEIKAVDPNLPELPKQQRILDIKKNYQDRFSKILGSSRADNFFRLDGAFRRKLADRLKNNRQQNSRNPRPFRKNN